MQDEYSMCNDGIPVLVLRCSQDLGSSESLRNKHKGLSMASRDTDIFKEEIIFISKYSSLESTFFFFFHRIWDLDREVHLG